MRSLGAAIAATVSVAVVAPSPAHAGRSHYGWLSGTEVVPERGVELESWLTEENQKGDDNVDETIWLFGATVGITDQLELGLPLEITWERSDAMPDAKFTIARYGAELRYRFVPSDPVEAPPFAPLLRVAAKRLTGARKTARLEANAVASYEYERLHALVDVGIVGVVGKGEDEYELRPGGGVAFEVIDDLRIGAEAYAEVRLRGDSVNWLTVGPTLGWTHGRFWLSAVAAVGVFGIQSAPRLKFGVAF